MSNLSTADRQYLENALRLDTGFVLNFTDATFRDFFAEFGINIDDPSANLKTIREILKSANKKSSTLFMSVDMRNHGEKSVFNNPYALRILGDNIGAARFINKYIR